jgi:hypothetical protein
MIFKSPNLLAVETKVAMVLCAYFQPECSAETTIDTISDAMTKINKQEALILPEDLNCRVDIRNLKSDMLISYLESESLLLTNDAAELTLPSVTMELAPLILSP